MNAIMVGFQGMHEMLERIHGKAQPAEEAEAEARAQALGTRARARAPVPAQPPPLTMEQALNLPIEQLPKLTPSAFDAMFSGPTGKPH